MDKNDSCNYRVQLCSSLSRQYVLANFSNGTISGNNLQKNFQLKQAEKGKKRFLCAERSSESQIPEGLSFHGEVKRQKFVKGNDGEDSCLAEKSLLICERNDEEKVLKIYLTTATCELTANVEGEKSNFDEEDRDQSKESTRDKKQNLIELFGDAKRKRGQRLKLKNRDVIDEKAAEKTVKESSQKVIEKLEGEEPAEEEDTMDDLRPPFNSEAKEPKKVYNMDMVFPPEVWQCLEDKSQELAKDADSDFKLLAHKYSIFIAELVAKNINQRQITANSPLFRCFIKDSQ